MKLLKRAELNDVNGAGAWDDFWDGVGETVGGWLAEASYSRHSREMHGMATNGGLNKFLENQNDPLL